MQPNASCTLTTDASKTGWGAVFLNTKTGGNFTSSESDLHINVLELKAVYFGLKALCNTIRETHILLKIDNTTAVHTLSLIHI